MLSLHPTIKIETGIVTIQLNATQCQEIADGIQAATETDDSPLADRWVLYQMIFAACGLAAATQVLHQIPGAKDPLAGENGRLLDARLGDATRQP
jgi:hypothetical protein